MYSAQVLEHLGEKGTPKPATFTPLTAQSALEEHGQSNVYTEANLRRHLVRSCRSTPQTPNYGAGAPKVLSSGFTVISSGSHNPGPKSCSIAYRNFNGPLMLSHCGSAITACQLRYTSAPTRRTVQLVLADAQMVPINVSNQMAGVEILIGRDQSRQLARC